MMIFTSITKPLKQREGSMWLCWKSTKWRYSKSVTITSTLMNRSIIHLCRICTAFTLRKTTKLLKITETKSFELIFKMALDNKFFNYRHSLFDTYLLIFITFSICRILLIQFDLILLIGECLIIH
jgi:hypothetical protein